MNSKVLIYSAVAACVLGCATSQLITIAAAGTALAAGSVVLSPAVAAGIGAAIIGGGAILKGIAIAAIAGGAGAHIGSRGGFRGRRQAVEQGKPALDDEALALGLVASTEPAQCYRRLICNLATGSMKPTELDIIPQFLARKEVNIESPEFEFSNAAKLGSSLKDIKACEVRYSCPLSSQEIEKLF